MKMHDVGHEYPSTTMDMPAEAKKPHKDYPTIYLRGDQIPFGELPEGKFCVVCEVRVAGMRNPALATAGTGDVLAGMTAGLLAQGLAPAEAAACALHLGGRAADAYTATRQARTMLATDLLAMLPHTFAD